VKTVRNRQMRVKKKAAWSSNTPERKDLPLSKKVVAVTLCTSERRKDNREQAGIGREQIAGDEKISCGKTRHVLKRQPGVQKPWRIVYFYSKAKDWGKKKSSSQTEKFEKK